MNAKELSLHELINWNSPLRRAGRWTKELPNSNVKEFSYTLMKSEVRPENEVAVVCDEFPEMEAHLLLSQAVAGLKTNELPSVAKIIAPPAITRLFEDPLLFHLPKSNHIYNQYQHWPKYFIFAHNAFRFNVESPISRTETDTTVTYSYSLRWVYTPSLVYCTDDVEMVGWAIHNNHPEGKVR